MHGFKHPGGAALLMMVPLRGVRPDLAAAALQPILWVKFAITGSLAAASLLAALRLSRPGLRFAWVPGALTAQVIAIWLLAAFTLMRADAAQRAGLCFGETADSCSRRQKPRGPGQS